MGSDGKAARKALRSVIESWFRREPASPERAEELQGRSIRTELSSTLFSADATEWVRYLGATEDARYEPDLRISVHLESQLGLLVFEPETEDSRWLAELLSFGFRELSRQLVAKPHVPAVRHRVIVEATLHFVHVDARLVDEAVRGASCIRRPIPSCLRLQEFEQQIRATAARAQMNVGEKDRAVVGFAGFG